MAIAGFANFEIGDLSEGFTTGGNVAISAAHTHSGVYSLRCYPGSGGTGYYQLSDFTPAQVALGVTSSTLQFRFYLYASTLPSATEPIFTTSYTGTVGYELRLSSTGSLSLYYGTTLLGSTAAGAITSGQYYLIYLMVSGTSGAGGSYELKIGATSQFSGTSTSGQQIDSVYLGKFRDLAGGSYDLYFDDVGWVTGSYPPDARGVVLTPNGVGSLSQWTGSYTDINQIPPDGSTTYLYCTSGNKKADFTFQSTSAQGIPPGSTINGVRVLGVMQGDNLNSVAMLFLIGGIPYNTINCMLSGTGTWKNYAGFVVTNPATGSLWTTSDLDALQIRLQTADPGNNEATGLYLFVDFVPAVPASNPLPRMSVVPVNPTRRLPTPAIAASMKARTLRHDPLPPTAITFVPIPEFHYLNRD